MKKIVRIFLVLALSAAPLVFSTPSPAKDGDVEKDKKVDILKPFEKADLGTVGISEVKAEQLKKAKHVIVEGVKEPPRADDDIEGFKAPKVDTEKVKPFDKLDAFSREALPLAGETEIAGALEFQGLDDTLKDETGLPLHKNSADAKIVENVFQFRHVTGNGRLGAPLFNQGVDPRSVTMQKGITQLDTEGNFQADLNGVQVDNIIEPGFQIGAAVFCGDGREVHRTGLFPLDETGSTRIEEQMIFPPDCAAPAVIFMGPEGMMIGAAGGSPVE